MAEIDLSKYGITGTTEIVYNPSYEMLYDEETKEFWLADEPSFYGRKADGTKLDEQYVDMIYREADKRCYFNDVADDILAQVPSFSGSVGYICEYDE